MPANHSVAVIDLGSNAVRLAIGHTTASTLLPVVTQFRREVHTMGRDVFETGTVSERTMEQLARHFIAFQKDATDRNVELVRAWGTSALRDARNRQAVQQYLLKKTGIAPAILCGEEEAALSARALAAALPEGNIAGIDVGGGSTEVCLIQDGTVQLTRSFDIGSMRLTQTLDPDALLDTFQQDCPGFPETRSVSLAATGGSADALVNVVCQSENMPQNTTRVPIAALQRAVQILTPLSLADRISQWSVDRTRAATIVMAGRILLAGAAATGARELLLPGAGLVHGLLLECLALSGGTNSGNSNAEPDSGPV